MSLKKKSYRFYSESFKRKVIDDYLLVGNKAAILHKYKIPYASAIQDWMGSLGYTDHWRQDESCTFGFSNSLLLSTKKDQTPEDLQKRIRELERQLQDEKLRSEGYRRMIKKAEGELKIQIEKKPGTK
jgi:transposase